MHFSSNVLITLRLTCFVNFHNIEWSILIVFASVFFFLNFGLIISEFIRRWKLSIFTGHNVPKDLSFDSFSMKICITNDISTSNMHLTFDRFGSGTEDLKSSKIFKNNITNKLELFIILSPEMFISFRS